MLAIYVTVGLSVLAHGLTAAPLADSYARWYGRHPSQTDAPMESAPDRGDPGPAVAVPRRGRDSDTDRGRLGDSRPKRRQGYGDMTDREWIDAFAHRARHRATR